MTTYYRRDEEVTDHMGNPVSGVTVYLCSQPANTSTVPPSPLVRLYADPEGDTPLNNPPQTDAYGHCYYYALPGLYTCVYYSPQIAGLTMVLTDQVISGVAPLPPAYNSDSSANGTISPLPDGTETEFTLSAVPNPKQSLVLSLNGLVVSNYTLLTGLATFVLPSPPPAGALLIATYQVLQ